MIYLYCAYFDGFSAFSYNPTLAFYGVMPKNYKFLKKNIDISFFQTYNKANMKNRRTRVSRGHSLCSESLRLVWAGGSVALNGLARAAPKENRVCADGLTFTVTKRLVCWHGWVGGFAVNLGGTAEVQDFCPFYLRGKGLFCCTETKKNEINERKSLLSETSLGFHYEIYPEFSTASRNGQNRSLLPRCEIQ